MNARQLILLSPYRLPTQSSLHLGDAEIAAFLNGYAALWHPAALALTVPAVAPAPPPAEHPPDDESAYSPPPENELPAWAPPRVGSPYDFEQPDGSHVYAVPEQPPLLLPDDWEQRARAAGAVVFKATADRRQTLDNLRAALASLNDENVNRLAASPPDRVAAFLGLGFGHLQLEALFEAMTHDNVLATAELGQDIARAVAALAEPDEAYRAPLQSGAERLQSAREVVYAVPIYLLDLCLLDYLEAPWPGTFERGLPCNFLASSAVLEQLGKEHPDRLAALRERVAAELAEVCGGNYLERESTLLPLESQLWGLEKGLRVAKELLGQDLKVYGRRRFGYHPQLPLLLQNFGIGHALLLPFDDAVLPAHRAPVVSWPSPDGKQVEAFTRAPTPVDGPQAGFHFAYNLHQTIMQDQAATLPFLHRGAPGAPWYDDLLELSRLAPVLGRWVTFSGYFGEVITGDYTSAASPDEMYGDYLSSRTGSAAEGEAPRPPVPHPITAFPRHWRGRRKLDTAWALASLLRGLGGRVGDVDGKPFEAHLRALEDRFELAWGEGGLPAEELESAQDRAAQALAQRLIARGQENNSGFLVLNPCSFTRRVALELPGMTAPPALGGPLKAAQVDEGLGKVVVEVPPLGFAWIPRGGAARPPPPGRLRLGDQMCVRNEFLEAEIDAQTGGLRAVRDVRTRVSRLGQMLVFHPGSTMRARGMKTVSAGPALGEIVTEGDLLGSQGEVLATFKQRFRAWLGRPVLDLRVELVPTKPVEGYPWHHYFGARFAWRDERSHLLRGHNGSSALTSHTRPESPDFLEVRLGAQNVVILPGGLPFHQRQGGRMVDVILVAQGETATVFDLAIGLDREVPMQTALGVVSPVAVVPTDRGPPHVGAAGWLFHVDAPNLLMTALRPVEGGNRVLARMFECVGHGGPAELRCVRDPKGAALIDCRGNVLQDATVEGDAVKLDVAPNDLVQVRIDLP